MATTIPPTLNLIASNITRPQYTIGNGNQRSSSIKPSTRVRCNTKALPTVAIGRRYLLDVALEVMKLLLEVSPSVPTFASLLGTRNSREVSTSKKCMSKSNA